MRAVRNSSSRLLVTVICFQILLSAQTASAQTSHPIHLKHGINIGRFLDGKLDNPYISACPNIDDPGSCTYNIEKILALGVDHVRILVEPGQMFDLSTKVGLNEQSASLAALDHLVNELLSQKIGIILALSLDEPRFHNKLGTEEQFLNELEQFWTKFAGHYSASEYTEYVFFEVLNEPGLDEPALTIAQWSGPKPLPEGGIQSALVHAIRVGAPRNTILAVGAEKSDINGLLALQPFTDVDNVGYVFHYYEPYSFTHQGQTWDTSFYPYYLSGVRYPYVAEPAEKAARNVPSLIDKLNAWHNMETATRDYINTDLEIVGEWAQHWKVTVICDEFGVQRKQADPAQPTHIIGADPNDRAVWVQDVRQLLGKYDIGWTFWDYSSPTFGLLPDSTVAGEQVTTALEFKTQSTP